MMMQPIKILKEIAVGFFRSTGQDWWVEITTAQPRCTYYFGPFERSLEAKAAHSGYVEDLKGEGASGIEVNIKRCKPATLTICEE